MTGVLAELAHYLRQRREHIVDRWAAYAEAAGEEVVSRLTREEFRNNIFGVIEALCRVVEVDTRDTMLEVSRREVGKHGHHRWKQGFDLQELIRDWGHLHRTLHEVFGDFFAEQPGVDVAAWREAFDRLSVFATEATSGSVRRYDELRRAEAASIHDDLAAAKAEFRQVEAARTRLVREAAHDLRGGMYAVSGATDLLRGEASSAKPEIVDMIDRSVASLQDLTDSLLDLSRLDAGQDPVALEETDAGVLLRRLAEDFTPVAEQRGLRLEVQGPQSLAVVTDPEKVRRIAQNLLTNALMHTVEGGVTLRWEDDALGWRLTVVDSGPGMQEQTGSALARELDTPERHANTVEVGTTSQRGEGIGLTIVKRLCEALDAGVELRSTPGEGTRVSVSLP